MDKPASTPGTGRKLPPLILHPFSDVHAPERLAASARASLMLHGLLPAEDHNVDELNRRLLDGRYHEVTMLYYVGKDLSRWLDQCMDAVRRDEELQRQGLEQASFAEFLVEDAPPAVREKMQRWGVADYKAIFRRALGLHAVFAAVPERVALSDGFLRHHNRYADALYECLQRAVPYASVKQNSFCFEIYASGEYTRMLEAEWNSD